MPDPRLDPRAGLHVGSRTAFTFFANVLSGYEQTLRDLIANAQGSPKADEAVKEIGTLHEFRWVLFDNDRRIMFCSSFDGSWDKYIQDFASTVIGLMIDRNLQHVEGWVSIKDPRASERLLAHAVPAVGYNSAYPQPTVKQVWQALALQQAFHQVLDTPGAAEALQQPALKPLADLAAY
ncbi:MAG: hypothetical protein JO202_18985 [Ktedonobacteraceae bacterium]|nr:hypothetical protein [Ktedonobacteraceae bacterium]